MSLVSVTNPVEPFLRTDRMPHIWCPGCGIGTTVNCFARALIESKIDLQSLALVSGIGCTGRVAGYVKLDSFHTTHGRAIPFATGLKLANPKLKVVVYSGDGDLSAIGGNHLIHAARRNIDLKVICVNNLIYAMTGGQTAPTTPGHAITSTSPYGACEPAFNLPHLVEATGAVYVARWTTFHVKQRARSISEAFRKKGFSFIEVISPCPTLYQRRNRLGDGLDTMKYYKEKSGVKHGASTGEVGLTMTGEIIVGKVRGSRPPRLPEPSARADGRVPRRSLRRTIGDRMQLQLTELRIAGFGGQGVILSAIILGKAASIHQGAYATMTQNFGPEARGGACSAQLLLSDEPILYPYVTQPDILVVMSQEAYTRFVPELKEGGTLIVEQDLVRNHRPAPPNEGLQLPGDPPRRRTRQANGVELGDGGVLCRRDKTARARCRSQGSGRLGAVEFPRSKPEGLR
jgi:2-oxoglutarate ferredoxin oxidoreductase subunit beta